MEAKGGRNRHILHSCHANVIKESFHATVDARFVPRHDDELELEVDDPLLVEVQGEDFWYEGYNMRSGARGIFPAYYAMEITKDSEQFKGTAQHPSFAF